MADLNISFETYNEEAVKNLQKNNPGILPAYSVNSQKDISYNKKQVNSAITSAIIQGQSIPDISKTLQNTIKNLNQSSAEKAARTAITSAQNAGTLSTMQELSDKGVEVQKEWVATLDDRTRDSHAVLDGERVGLYEEFSNGLQYPGDASGDPAEVWNCRCTVVSYIPKYDSETNDATRWSKDPETGERQYVSDMSYTQWEKLKEYNNTDVSMFTEAVKTAQAAQDASAAWRVTASSIEEFIANHSGASCHITAGGSTVAVTLDRDIVSLCKMNGDSMTGKEIIAQAVEAGGIKLDSYSGNHTFYVKCGFEPVSWCKWDDKYAPAGWNASRDAREDIIFYKYVGKKGSYSSETLNVDNFLSSTPASKDYDTAKAVRDSKI